MKLLCFLTICTLLFGDGEKSISNAERKNAVIYLKKTSEELSKAIRRLRPDQLKFKVTPESWSIEQCLEHIATSEIIIYENIKKMLLKPADPSRRAEIKYSDKEMLKAAIDRTTKFKAPEVLVPRGKYSNADESLRAFRMKRTEVIDFIKTTDQDLRNHFGKHLAFGTIDAYQWVLIAAAHVERHTLQIEEIMTSSTFPKK